MMKTKTFSVSGGGYVAPTCKVYSITADSHILQGSPNYGSKGAAGADVSYNNYDEDF